MRVWRVQRVQWCLRAVSILYGDRWTLHLVSWIGPLTSFPATDSGGVRRPVCCSNFPMSLEMERLPLAEPMSVVGTPNRYLARNARNEATM